jgi:anti-sigma B factor antagonist
MTAEPFLDIDVVPRDGWTLARVAGELDMATTPQLESMCDGLDSLVALDLSRVRFIDSTGLRSLVRIRERREGMVLVAPSVAVRRLLSLTQLADGFTIVASTEDLEAG